MREEVSPDQVVTISRDVQLEKVETVGNTADTANDRVTVHLDVPLDAWERMSELDRADAINRAEARLIERMREIEREREQQERGS